LSEAGRKTLLFYYLYFVAQISGNIDKREVYNLRVLARERVSKADAFPATIATLVTVAGTFDPCP